MLRELSDKLGTTEQIAGCIIVQVLLQKLDPASQAKWEERLEDPAVVNIFPTWESMASFLEQRCRTLETMDFAMASYASGNQAGPQLPEAIAAVASNTVVEPSAVPSSSTALIAQDFSTDIVLLATAPVLIKNRSGVFVPCRALLDSGSQLHLITSRFADQLQIKKIKTSTSVTGIGDSSFVTNGHSVNITMQSRTYEYTVNITAVIAPNITERQTSFNVDIGRWKIPQNIQLADPTFFVLQRVYLLIGASLFYELLCVGQIKLPPGLPLIQKTRLGWVVSGGYGVSNGSALISTIPLPIVSRDNSLDRLDDLLRRFWEVVSCVEPIAHATKEELDCETHFKKHFIRSPAGDYSVRLPAKFNLELLGESYQQAYRRFLSLERKLDRRPALKAQYAAFIKEYLDLGHMSTVAGADLASCRFFLPHHCVIKEESSTTKLRVVFDGSAATSSGYSPNDLLMAGPVIQHTLFQILIRFRSYPVAITGDICKMHRCVKVHPEDSYLQCILWRTSPQDKLQVYKLDTVTYGTKPASFLAVRAMHQLSRDEHSSFPLWAEVIQRDFYVDDLISGAQTVDEAIIIVDQTSKILSRGGFKLRKWCSNVPAALCGVSDEDKESYLKFDDGTDFTKTMVDLKSL
ncbi:uncharacterized protein LOC122320333 [Drosophila ficusphila]|uniref:uncharacterized protein LOC122320333 n=1 Tax=Drosophila ficusphila TaxID=30025 RepID=UPI001C89A115|nr:uncharacterized protein LOC122320333 [Drosophila ficusphila]